MKFLISKSIKKLYSLSNKNPDAMLEYLLGSVDTEICKSYASTSLQVFFKDTKTEIEINSYNISLIKTLFGEVNNTLIEILLLNASLLQEI